VSGLLIAVRYLTIVPLPAGRAGDEIALGRAAAWFPVVGLVVGAFVAVADRLAAWLFPAVLGSLVTVTAWKIVTGGLHLDGLADCLDGLGGTDRAHRLRIMDDSRIGAFGVTGLIFFLLFEIGVVAELPPAQRWRALLLAPTVARATPAVLARMFRRAKPDGHGAQFGDGLTAAGVAVAAAAAVAAALLLLAAEGIVAAVVAAAVAVVVGAFMDRRLGGITGDVLGAGIETAELAVLVTVMAWAHAAR
jgi:adenosylcobinamide-GDP ribazoletransferase